MVYQTLMTPTCRALLVHARDFVSAPTFFRQLAEKGDQPHKQLL